MSADTHRFPVWDLRRYSYVNDAGSLANRFRTKRFALFEDLASRLPRPLRLLDVGGTEVFWENRGWAGRDDVDITLLNLTAGTPKHANLHEVAGDATDLSRWPDRAFDLVFSNSVIEHLYAWERQVAMAREMQRVAAACFLQVPSYTFPIEPHYLVPAWHWLPQAPRAALLQRRRVGNRGPIPDPLTAQSRVREIRLLTRGELAWMFPGSTIVAERFLGLPKSWIVTRGFPG